MTEWISATGGRAETPSVPTVAAVRPTYTCTGQREELALVELAVGLRRVSLSIRSAR